MNALHENCLIKVKCGEVVNYKTVIFMVQHNYQFTIPNSLVRIVKGQTIISIAINMAMVLGEVTVTMVMSIGYKLC